MLCIIFGVVVMQVGVWWQLDENGVDKGGCVNVFSLVCIIVLVKGNLY